MAEKLAIAFSSKIQEEPEFIGIPEYSDIMTVSEMLVEKENILVIVGPQVSQFSGNFGFDDKESKELLNLENLSKDSEKVINFLEKSREEVEKVYPNKLHFALARLLAFSKIIEINLSFLNMSTDGLLRKAYDELTSNSSEGKSKFKNNDIKIEINNEKENNQNGENEKELEIIDFFGDIFEDRKIEVGDGKFHSLPRIYLQGESLNDFHPGLDSITDRIREAQVLVIAGQIPENSFLQAIVGNFIEFGIPIVELGDTPQLEVGNVMKVVGELPETLFELERGIQESYSELSGLEISEFYLF